MTKTQIIALFQPGQQITVTNHYITRPDHPCFGTRPRIVASVNTSAIHFYPSGRVAWPKRTQMDYDGQIVRLYGGGAGQQPTDLFLSIEMPSTTTT